MASVYERVMETALKASDIFWRSHTMKKMTARISLLALGVTFELTSKYVPEMHAEISDWENGRRVGIGVLPQGPNVTVIKKGNRFRYLGMALKDPHISVLFKNMDSAMLIFTGLIGAHQAVAENRVCVHGENYQAMQVTRAMAIVQTYLFPDFLLRKTFKRPPVLSARQVATKAKIMGLLLPKLIFSALK
ncbi:hypothetical protein ACFL27_02930 [candidate division CSSED10-310 bacterium]|uniref:SCP2 domain-containing protein n=1 Tax=candidate division CSSED10-310 bacterium TaxID=2855610 RepID=A0ABV6YSL3_UNCC1